MGAEAEAEAEAAPDALVGKRNALADAQPDANPDASPDAKPDANPDADPGYHGPPPPGPPPLVQEGPAEVSPPQCTSEALSQCPHPHTPACCPYYLCSSCGHHYYR